MTAGSLPTASTRYNSLRSAHMMQRNSGDTGDTGKPVASGKTNQPGDERTAHTGEENVRHSQKQPSLMTGLPPVLGIADLTALMVLIVLFVSNTNGVQFGGPVSFLYWLLGMLTFLLPCAVVTRWLARRYPGQGAPYLWAARVLGPGWSFFSAFCAWLPGVLAVVSVIESGIVFIQYLAPTWFVTPVQQCPVIVLALLLATGVTCLPLRWVRRVLLAMTGLYLSVFLMLGLAGVYWLASGHASAVSFTRPAAWQPNGNNFALYGIIVLALLGVDIPIFLGSEIRGARPRVAAHRASNYVWWGSALSFLAYVLGTFGIMVIVPSSQAGVILANVQAISTVFGPLAGTIADIVLLLSQVAIVMAYLLLFSRLLVVVAQDRRLPAVLASVNQHGVPVASILMQATLVAVVTILSYVAVPLLFESVIDPSALAVEIYNVTQAGTTVVWVCSIIQTFLLVLILQVRRRVREKSSGRLQGNHEEQPISSRSRFRHVVFIAISVMGIFASLVGAWATISSSWLPSLIPDTRWSVLVLGVTAVSLLIGWVVSEVPRMHSLLGEQRRLNNREVALREQLQDSYNEQEMLLLQHKELLAELDRLYHEQAQAAVTDAITGLPNHRAVMNRVEEEISRCHRQREQRERGEQREGGEGACAVLFVDLDHFKSVNDTWGHRAGDAMLREVGHRLRATLRLEDFVGRYGGEEFAIILTGVDLYTAVQVAERLRAAIATEPCRWDTIEHPTKLELYSDAPSFVGAELASALSSSPEPASTLSSSAESPSVPQSSSAIAITASIGVALYGLHGYTREALIESADHAMYRAKHGGRNRVCIADRESAEVQEISPERKAQADGYADDTVAQDRGIKALTAAASAHDRGTDAHAQRLVELAESTAQRLGLPEEEMHLIRLGALLHDIGKIGIPDAILHKPGPLSDEEWVVMRRHPEIGRQILEQTGGVFEHLAHIVAAHHERWDGRGYPGGLLAEAIPMCSRILSVVDAYDAMTSRRVYREPLLQDAAQDELRRCAGSQFDPHVVEAFLAVLAARNDEQPLSPYATVPL